MYVRTFRVWRRGQEKKSRGQKETITGNLIVKHKSDGRKKQQQFNMTQKTEQHEPRPKTGDKFICS